MTKDIIDSGLLEQAVYLALVPLFEKHLNLDPCPAIKLANAECAAMTRFIVEFIAEDKRGRSASSTVRGTCSLGKIQDASIPRNCPGGSGCTCCHSGCDCGCRDECPEWLRLCRCVNR